MPRKRVRLPIAWRGIAAIALCVSALVAVAGCGGGSDDRLTKEEYLQEFKGIVSDLDAGFQELFESEPDSSDFGAVAEQVDALGGAFDELVGRVEKLAPPEEIEASHDKLLDGLREFAGWAHELADKIQTAPAAELVALVEEYGLNDSDFTKVPGAAKLQEAIDEFEDAGYTVGETETTTEAEPPPADADAAAGKEIFLGSAGCATCHTLSDSGATGNIGPSLDAARPSYSLVVDRVTNGRGVMPPFGSQLSEEQIQDVAAYVSSVAGR